MTRAPIVPATPSTRPTAGRSWLLSRRSASPTTRPRRADSRLRAALGGLLLTACATFASAASLDLKLSSANNFDYLRQLTIPSGFGSGEFTLELWIKPNNAYPIGSTASGSGQLNNWSSADISPYSSSGWWYEGNFLLDGHNNAGSNFQNGTFTLQFYGRGRVRWLFGDGASGNVSGRVWSVGAYPATDAPTLLDGQWHHIALVRRFSGSSGSQLELWQDGVLIDTENSSTRANMRQWWDSWSGFYSDQRGWFWGLFSQYEDYKGLIDELRFWSRAKTSSELNTNWRAAVTGAESGLVGRYAFGEGTGSSTCSSITPSNCITLVNASNAWNSGEAPVGDSGGGADTSAPSVPGSLQGSSSSSSAVSLSWTASTDNVGVANYRVMRDGLAIGTAAGTTYNDTGRAANTTYTYTVSAVDSAGNRSAESAARQVTTQTSAPAADTAPPSVPASLAGTSTSSTVALTWGASSDNVGVASYRVRRNGTTVGTVSGTSFSDSGLSASTTYSYTVSAVDAAGNRSAESASRQVTTAAAASPPPGGADKTQPTAPSNLAGSATSNSVTLTWTAATDNVGVVKYNIWRSGYAAGSTTGTSFTQTGLSAGQPYSYTVSAVDAAGNESADTPALLITTSRQGE
jgi:chitodextrinase